MPTEQTELPLELVTDIQLLKAAAFDQVQIRDQAQANIAALLGRIQEIEKAGPENTVVDPPEEPVHNGRVTAKKQPARAARAKGA